MNAKEGLQDVLQQAIQAGYHTQAVAIQDGLNEIKRLEDELYKTQTELKSRDETERVN